MNLYRKGLHMNQGLDVTYFLNYDDSSVREFAQKHTEGLTSPKAQAVKLFEVVRDRFAYDPYNINLQKKAMRASEILKRDSAYCNEKAIVLASALRYLGIPARLYFGNVRNHIATEKLQNLLGTDVMAFHGCVEIWLNGKWLKATPAFNASLCHRLGVEPLVFDGEEDAIFQQFSKDGRRFMDYIEIHGSFDDMPYDLFVAELKKQYGHLIQEGDMHYKLA
jgi:transglutaminase-like putative cysteine protease